MTGLSEGFQRVARQVIHQGNFITLYRERFRHADGEEVSRDVVHHPGAVAVVAYDQQQVWLIRQPREAVGEQALLEIPAGKLDVEGEQPLETAKRELAEEIGKAASRWEPVATCYMTPGFANEKMYIFAATELGDAAVEHDGSERIELAPWPLSELDAAIAQCQDAKSLVGLLWLRLRLVSSG